MNQIINDMPEADYHRRPELSSTEARYILDSPARYKHWKAHRRPDKVEFDLGSAIHSKVLGTGYQIAVIPEEYLGAGGSANTVAARGFIAEARACGVVPIKPEAARNADAAAESVLAHPTARELFNQEGAAEASVFATDPATGVDMRARFDWLAERPVDLKSARSAAPLDFARSAANYGYDVQEAHYLETLHLVTGDRRDMTFVVVETAAPYLVAVHQLDENFADIGRLRARRAREIYAECLATDTWPGYPDGINELSAPAYHLYENDPEEEMVI